MLKQQIGDIDLKFVCWVFVNFIARFFFGMSSSIDGPKPQNGVVSRSTKSPFRTISSYLRIVSSGAQTVARSAVSVASSIVERDDVSSHDQVLWAGFDKLEGEGDVTQRVLLLGYRSGFQVWDVEDAENVHDLISRCDGPVSFMQMLPRPIISKGTRDKFAEVRPLMIVCANGSHSCGSNIEDGLATTCNGTAANQHNLGNGSSVPTVCFYSLRTQSCVHMLKFRSAIYSVRCSSRVVAICQAAQVHCFDATALEIEYVILTNPIVMGHPSSGGIGCGPLAVGPRWLAYSGSPVVVSNAGRVSAEYLTHSQSFSGFASNGIRIAHYAKESSKNLAAGIVTLGDIGYKKLSRYCSEHLLDSQNSLQLTILGGKSNGTVNGHLPDADNVGMVIVRDIVSKGVIAQFRAHKSPISALCFDPSGILLVTASVQGHNINIFKIMPCLQGSSSACDAGTSFVHLYRLQRGFTNAVIQDISFSDDSNWIMVSSSRGTSHLFAINPLGGSVNFQSTDASFTTKHSGLGVMAMSGVRWPPNLGLQMPNQQSLCAAGPPFTLSVVNRIRNGCNGWRGTVSSAAAAATGRVSSLSGAIASSFHNCKCNSETRTGGSSSNAKNHLLVFSPSGCMIQYALRISTCLDVAMGVPGSGTAYDSVAEDNPRLVVEAIQKWNICQKQTRREWEDNIDIYGENGTLDSKKIYPEEINEGNCTFNKANSDMVKKKKLTAEDMYHLYISEAELQMHPPRVPLWAKPQIYFQSMIIEDVKMEEENYLKGEIEIERFPTHMIEAKSKDLIPFFDYLQGPKFPQARVTAADSYSNERLLLSRLSENGHPSSRSSSGSLDSVTGNGALAAKLNNGIEEISLNGPQMPVDTKGFVNNSDSPKTKTCLEIANNSESLRMEAKLKFVGSNIVGLKMENHFEDEGGEFD